MRAKVLSYIGACIALLRLFEMVHEAKTGIIIERNDRFFDNPSTESSEDSWFEEKQAFEVDNPKQNSPE